MLFSCKHDVFLSKHRNNAQFNRVKCPSKTELELLHQEDIHWNFGVGSDLGKCVGLPEMKKKDGV